MDSTTTVTHRPESVQMTVEGFRALANLISTGTLPPPHGGPIYRWVGSAAEVEEFAAKHDVEVRTHDGNGKHFTTARLVVAHLSPSPVDDLEYVIVHSEDVPA